MQAPRGQHWKKAQVQHTAALNACCHTAPVAALPAVLACMPCASFEPGGASAAMRRSAGECRYQQAIVGETPQVTQYSLSGALAQWGQAAAIQPSTAAHVANEGLRSHPAACQPPQTRPYGAAAPPPPAAPARQLPAQSPPAGPAAGGRGPAATAAAPARSPRRPGSDCAAAVAAPRAGAGPVQLPPRPLPIQTGAAADAAHLAAADRHQRRPGQAQWRSCCLCRLRWAARLACAPLPSRASPATRRGCARGWFTTVAAADERSRRAQGCSVAVRELHNS